MSSKNTLVAPLLFLTLCLWISAAVAQGIDDTSEQEPQPWLSIPHAWEHEVEHITVPRPWRQLAGTVQERARALSRPWPHVLVEPRSHGRTVAEVEPANTVAPADRCPAIGQGEVRAIWVWREELLQTPRGRSTFRAFAEARGINHVYIEAYRLLREDRLTLAAISATLSEACINVELLFGDPSWALPPYHRTVITTVRSAVEFIAALPAGQPVGIHIDIEPHILSEWDDDLQGTANHFIDLMEHLAKELEGSGLRFSVDAGLFYDDRYIARRGITRSLSEWIIDLVDVYVVMDYRDTPAEIVHQAAAEMAYADVTGGNVLIGILANQRESKKITFFEEGEAAMNRSVSVAHRQLSTHPSFFGLAYHDYRAFLSMRP